MGAGIVCFAHGKESGPWGTKISCLSKIAQLKGFDVLSPDYSHLMDPDERVLLLLEQSLETDTLVLVGSSMGGYVSTVASKTLKPKGLFLLAPAFYIPDYEEQEPLPDASVGCLIHGWQDEVIPVEHSIRFSKKHNFPLVILKSDHRLVDQLHLMEEYFSLFLDQVIKSSYF